MPPLFFNRLLTSLGLCVIAQKLANIEIPLTIYSNFRYFPLKVLVLPCVAPILLYNYLTLLYVIIIVIRYSLSKASIIIQYNQVMP